MCTGAEEPAILQGQASLEARSHVVHGAGQVAEPCHGQSQSEADVASLAQILHGLEPLQRVQQERAGVRVVALCEGKAAKQVERNCAMIRIAQVFPAGECLASQSDTFRRVPGKQRLDPQVGEGLGNSGGIVPLVGQGQCLLQCGPRPLEVALVGEEQSPVEQHPRARG